MDRPAVPFDLLFGRLVAVVRVSSFRTQIEFARACTVPAGTIARIEAGRNSPSALHLVLLDRGLERNVMGFNPGDLVWMTTLAIDRAIELGWSVKRKRLPADYPGPVVPIDDVDDLVVEVVNKVVDGIYEERDSAYTPVVDWFQ